MTKEEIRKKIKEEKLRYPVAEIKEDSSIITKYILSSSDYKNCDTLFCYVSFNQEVSTIELLKQALKEKKVAVPKIVNKEMKFYYIRSFDDLTPGTLGILEPNVETEAIPDKLQHNLCIVPGLAFDLKRNRIGYGKGYYDSFFHKYEEIQIPIKKLAVAFDFQIFREVENNFYDKKVDTVITPTRVIGKL